MWNIKHLIIAIIFTVCAIVCAFSFIVFGGANLAGTGFMGDGGSNNFAPMGAVIFAFFAIVFFRNSRR